MVPETVEKTQDTVPYEKVKYSDWSEKTRALKFNDEHCQPLLLICSPVNTEYNYMYLSVNTEYNYMYLSVKT